MLGRLSLGLSGGLLLLGVLLQDHESFIDLGVQGVRVVEEMQELAVVHLQQHASDFARKLRLSTVGRESSVCGRSSGKTEAYVAILT